jgi:hypothetical protein
MTKMKMTIEATQEGEIKADREVEVKEVRGDL